MLHNLKIFLIASVAIMVHALPVAAQNSGQSGLLTEELTYHYLVQLADAGDAEAAFQVAFARTFGAGTTKDPEVRNRYLEMAIAKNHPRALLFRGLDHEYGSDLIAQDFALAISFYLRSAKAGSVQGQTTMAENYEEGTLVPLDMTRAGAWYILAVRTAKLDPNYITDQGEDAITDLEAQRDRVLALLSAEQSKAADTLSYTLLQDIQS